MDILAHSLWNYAAYRAVFKKREPPKKLHRDALLAGLFGIFPDIFAFGYLVMSRLWQKTSIIFPYAEARFMMVYNGNLGRQIAERLRFNPSPGCGISPAIDKDILPCMPHYVYQLYNFSHSLIIFGLVFALVWVAARKPFLPLLGWGLHIIIDIFSHNDMFFPTPFLYPVSNFHVNGVSWANPVFMAVNYSLLLAAYLMIYIGRRKRKNKSDEDTVFKGTESQSFG